MSDLLEDVAKERWCPFARPASVLPEHCGEVRGNRNFDGLPDSGSMCLGSGCMAWVPTREKFKDSRTGVISDRNLSGNGMWVKFGVCGLARGADQ